ncbi:MAG: PEGA domain-containing protein [bacterium]
MPIMQRKYRRIIFYLFAALFITSVPFLLLYTSGYRYNIKKNKFEKTGTLLINTLTKTPSLYLNGNAVAGKNEFRIQNLLPGEYDVKIVKPGFFDWQKKLSVKSELTTFVKDVRMIENNLPENIISETAGAIYPSPDQSKFLYVKKEAGKYSLKLFSSSDDSLKNILSLGEPVISIAWSPDNDKIILEMKSGFKIANISDRKIQDLPVKTKISRLRWDTNNNFLLFAKTADGIYKIDIIFNSASKIYALKNGAADFMVFQNYLYLADGAGLTQINLDNNEPILAPFERDGYKIKSIADKRIFLIDSEEHMQIFNLPLNKLSTPELFASAKDFDVSGNSLLYYNDFELWTYNFGTGDKELITRLGEVIKKARWLPGASHIVFSLNNQIKIIEMDKRDSRQIYDFPKFEEIGDFILNPKYTLYFTGKLNRESGIYKLKN